jgi:general secretion pathway protein K
MIAPTPRPMSPRARARARRRRAERGVALIMVLGAIAIMVVMLAEFQDDAGAEFAAATAARDGVQAEYYARSAINLERLLIASEPMMRQAITPLFALMKQTPPQLPVWDYSDRILGAFNDPDSAKDFAGFSGLDTTRGKNLGLVQGGHFEITVVDEDAKINVNMGAANEIAHLRLAKELMSTMMPIQFNSLFEQHDSTGNYNDRLTICSALIDWADQDEQLFSCDLTSSPSSNAVEDSWYQLLAKPYRRKNAPYDSLEEMRMVRGVSDDFWAAFVDPEPNDPRKRLMTVWGQGKINVNAANPLTLFGVVCSGAPTAQLCIDPLQMQMFVMGMMMAKGMTMGAPLFGAPSDFVNMMEGKGMLGPMLTMMGMQPVKFQSVSDFTKSISTSSKVFSIYAVGAVKGFRRETRVKIHIVVDFRGIDPITGSASSAAPASSAAATQATASSGMMGPITTALQAQVGGKILYFNIE